MNTIAFLMASLATGQADDTDAVRARIAITVAIQQMRQRDYVPPPPKTIPAAPANERIDNQKRIQKQTSGLKLIAPNYQGEVRQPPRPFSGDKLASGNLPTADADQNATSSWRWTDADVPEYMTRYTPAKYTQEIAVTNGRDRISPVPRTRLEAKWHVPGGLAGINGWVSELWSWAPRRTWVGNIPVLNSYGHFQQNRGWKVSYEPGTEFLDVLKNKASGEVFEVRKAMKTDKGWQRFVTYRRAEHRPAGYHGPKGLNCKSCHDEAGSGGYATGLVPGGDTVLSMPFENLE